MRILRPWLIGMMVVFVASCQHKDLCYLHPHTLPVQVDVDWSEFVVEQPTGMTVMAFNTQGPPPYQKTTHDLNQVTFDLPRGEYFFLAFNQSESEFGSFSFRNMDCFETAEVVTATYKSPWYKTKSEEELVAVEPEWLGVDRSGPFVVTDEMIELHAKAMQLNVRGPELAGAITTLMPHNVVYTIYVEVYNINNIYNLRAARASIDQMAEGYLLGLGHANDNHVTHLMENWQSYTYEEDASKGYLTTTFTCFGLPGNHQGTAEENELCLHLLLVDNETVVEHRVHIGDQFEVHHDEHTLSMSLHLKLDLNITLPDVEPVEGGGGGFDATVDDWGDEIEHNVDL